MTAKNTLYAKILFYFWWVLVMLIPGQTSAQVYADSETNGASTNCVGCYVHEPHHAVDASFSDYAIIKLTVSTPGEYVYQNLHFSSPGSSGNYVGVVVEDTGLVALNASLLAGVYLTTYLNNVSNNDTKNSSQFSITLAPGSTTRYALEFQATHAFDAIRIQLMAGTPGIAKYLHIYYAFRSTTALPIELFSFTATQRHKEVIINWSTLTELNNDFFTIEESADGVNFTEAGTVDGAGTATIMNHYSFTDKKPTPGVSYYRLKQTDFNGKTKIFQVIPLNYELKEVLEVFPNPAVSKTIKMRLSHTEAGLISVHDERGLLVYEHHYQPEGAMVWHEITCTLPAGVFYVSLATAHVSEIKKIVVLE